MRSIFGVESPGWRLLSLICPLILCAGRAGADSVVVFNEIQYHPAGNEAQLEWLELHNQMAVDVDISGWYLGSGVSFVFEEGTIIAGRGYLVVAASPAALEAATGHDQALGPFEGRLDNAGETLELFDRNARLLDSVRYGDGNDWPAGADGSGATLAKRHPDLASQPASSWTHSLQVSGTPGARNFFDPEAPTGGLPRDVLSYWSLDEAGGSFSDLAGGNNGSPGAGASRVPGLTGTGAVSFNNTTNAFVNVGAGAGTSYSVTTGITIEAIIQASWSGALDDHDQIFRKEDGANRMLLALQNDGNSNGFSLPAVGPGPVLAFGLNVGGTYSELDMLLDGQEGRPALATLLDGMPHHVAATYDSATGRKSLYFDGVLAFSVDLTAGSLITSGGGSTAYIGNMTGRGEPFTGIIDEVAIWRRALRAAEVARHASQAAARKSYFEAEPDPEPTATAPLAFNETSAGAGQAAFVEIANLDDVAIDLRDHVIQRLGAGADELILSSGSIAASGHAAWTAAQLGFTPVAGDTLFLWAPGRTTVIAAVQIEEGLHGRFPDGSGRWLLPSQPTPGAANAFAFRDEVVINEIMYHHRGDTSTGSFAASAEAWIEAFNRSEAAVPLTGWRLDGGVGYAFPDGTVLGAGEYLVVAQDAAALQAKYPGVRVLGNLTGQLSNASDLIRLEDASGNPADEVRYQDSGRWPEYADGGGSSLELRDSRADNAAAEAWAPSDEASKSEWKSYSYRMVAAANVGPTQWREFVLGLLAAGEALVDDIHVVETPATAPKELLQNSTFNAGTSKWRILGNHGASSAVADETGQVLHLVASGPTEHMHNHLETTLAGGASVVNGREYEVSFRARWLGGSNRLHTRLYFNRAPRTTLLDVPPLNGTPGASNSRLEADIGPTYAGFQHAPVVPAPTQPVTVSVVASDPDGVAGVLLWSSVNGGAWSSSPMTARGGGRYDGTIPAQNAGALVQFYVEGTDTRGAASTSPAAGRDSRALYRVQDGVAMLARVHNVRILMTAADTSLLHLNTNVMSNQRLGATIVYDEREAFYDAGVRLKGSERGRNVSARVGFNIRIDPEHKLRGVHERFDVDRSGGWVFGGPFGQDEIVIKHMVQRAGGIPGMYDDLIRVIAPRSAQTGPAILIMAAFGDVYLDSQYLQGGDGDTFEMGFIYHPTSTTGGVEGLKLPEPDGVIGADFSNLGNDKEPYRWNFLIDSHRDRDDYSRLIALSKAFGTATAGLEAAARSVIDVDQWMRAFAMQSLCGITDAYTRGNNHNFVVYFPPLGAPALAFLWDQDFAYVQPTTAALWGDQNLGRIIQLTPNRRLYYGHLLDLMSQTVNTQYMSRWTAHYGSLAGQSYASVLTYLGQRATFVRQQIPARVPFAITTQNGEDFTVDAPSTLLEGNGWFDVRGILVAGADDVAEVQWPTLTKWRTTVPLQPGPNVLELLAFDWRGNVVGSDTITVVSTSDPPPPTFIRGDVSLNRGIEITDAVKLLLFLFAGGAIDCQDAADATNDELLDVADVIYSLNYLFRGGPAPQAPYPTAGFDTGAGDRLGCERGL